MRNFTIITIPPADQKFVTIWIRLNNFRLDELMLVKYRTTGSTILNPSIKEKILQDYQDFRNREIEIEDYFQVNIVEAMLSLNPDKEEYSISQKSWNYDLQNNVCRY